MTEAADTVQKKDDSGKERRCPVCGISLRKTAKYCDLCGEEL